MFDRYVIAPHPSSITVNHTEKRAPTDESVKLLREMESAARSSVVEAMRIESNTVKAVVHRHLVVMDQRTVFSIHYAINGQKRECIVGIEDFNTTIEKRLDIIWRALADDIASFIIGATIKDIAPK